jgi:hypothetical protein
MRLAAALKSASLPVSDPSELNGTRIADLPDEANAISTPDSPPAESAPRNAAIKSRMLALSSAAVSDISNYSVRSNGSDRSSASAITARSEQLGAPESKAAALARISSMLPSNHDSDSPGTAPRRLASGVYYSGTSAHSARSLESAGKDAMTRSLRSFHSVGSAYMISPAEVVVSAVEPATTPAAAASAHRSSRLGKADLLPSGGVGPHAPSNSAVKKSILKRRESEVSSDSVGSDQISSSSGGTDVAAARYDGIEKRMISATDSSISSQTRRRATFADDIGAGPIAKVHRVLNTHNSVDHEGGAYWPKSKREPSETPTACCIIA